jgi:ubiquinone/menaquinone biosynthesis C-methylase UbiE
MFSYEALTDPLWRDVRERTPEFSGMKAGDKVLDVCCGTGAQTLEYGRRGIIATGVDINPDVLNIARSNGVKQRVVNVSFQLADATNLPFPDGYFDYASVFLGLHDKERPIRNQIVSEMKRVVKQGGALILLDFQVPLPRNIGGVLMRVMEFLIGGSHYRGFKDYLRNGGLDGILKKHGLREERRIYLKGGLIAAAKVMGSLGS